MDKIRFALKEYRMKRGAQFIHRDYLCRVTMTKPSTIEGQWRIYYKVIGTATT